MTKLNRDAIYKIIADISHKDKTTFSEASRLRADLNMDSLSALDLVVTIEEDFQIKITQDKLRNLVTIGDLFKILDI